MANLITFLRLLLVFIVVMIIEYATPFWQISASPLIILAMILDGVDGYIARRRKESSLFGAVFDIAADRIIEITLWVVLAKHNLVPIWVPIIFITRGILVDSLRKKYSDIGKAPFSIMKTSIGKFLVASRFMRFLYGGLKLLAFVWLLFLIPAQALWSAYYLNNIIVINILNNILIYSTVTICLLRGLPVIMESILFPLNTVD